MIRRHRAVGASDSLELLLDTICNVFGGIILMAVLVVLMTQGWVGSVEGHASEDIEAARQEVARLRALRETLRAESTRLQDAAAATASPDTEGLLVRQRDFEDAVAAAEQRLPALEAAMAGARRELSTSEAESAIEQKRLEDGEAQTTSLRRRLIRLESQPREKVRLPHRKGTAYGTARYYVVQGGKVYRCGVGGTSRWTGGSYREEDCIFEPVGSIIAKAARITPVKGAGIQVPPAGASAAAVVKTLQMCRPDTHYVVFWVHTDSSSFESFQRMKSIVVDEGYRYTVSPYQGEYVGVVASSGHQTE